MNNAQFWNLVTESRAESTDCEAQATELSRLLENLEPKEIVSFYNFWRQKSREAYRWDLWAVAYIINGGCSDDSFTDFRSWLIAQGKTAFEEALASPESAANYIEDGEEATCEDINYAATAAYTRKTGQAISFEDVEGKYPDDPAGLAWEEEDLPRLYPQLCERFDM